MSETVKDISSEKIRQLENSISQNWPVPKLASLPQGVHKKIEEKKDFCPSLYLDDHIIIRSVCFFLLSRPTWKEVNATAGIGGQGN